MTLVRAWRGVWKLIELEGTRLIKYVADLIASLPNKISVFLLLSRKHEQPLTSAYFFVQRLHFAGVYWNK